MLRARFERLTAALALVNVGSTPGQLVIPKGRADSGAIGPLIPE
jgi:hypothetical protein